MFLHGKNTYITVSGHDMSGFTNTSTIERGADSHDVTVYGDDGHEFEGGLLINTASMGGFYDTTAAGPRAILEPLVGTKVTLIRRPEGTGAGKPQDTCTVLITKYNETNPVADMVTWSCDMQVSGVVTASTQGA